MCCGGICLEDSQARNHCTSEWIFVNLRKGPDTTCFLLGSKLCQKFVCKHIVQFGGLKVDDNSRLWSPFGFLVELEMRMEEMLKHFMR